MRIKSFLALVVLGLVISGCALQPTSNKDANTKAPTSSTSSPSATVVKPPSSNKQDHTLDLLSFLDSYSNMTPDAQKKAFTTISQALNDNKSDVVLRIKLAGMYAIPSSKLRDLSKAQSQLQDLLQENLLSGGDYYLVSLLYEYTVFDNKQIARERDELKKLDTTTQRMENTQQKLDALQQKYDALEQKLNDLKNIEKTLNERGSRSTK